MTKVSFDVEKNRLTIYGPNLKDVWTVEYVIAFMPDFFGREVSWASGGYINNVRLSEAEEAFWKRITG